MAYKELKLEIEYLKKIFPETHNVFRIVSASVDDVTCLFCDLNETISCNITVSYIFFGNVYMLVYCIVNAHYFLQHHCKLYILW